MLCGLIKSSSLQPLPPVYSLWGDLSTLLGDRRYALALRLAGGPPSSLAADRRSAAGPGLPVVSAANPSTSEGSARSRLAGGLIPELYHSTRFYPPPSVRVVSEGAQELYHSTRFFIPPSEEGCGL
jgi:hypothetical protein